MVAQADTNCPLCHADNHCEVARGNDIAQCWCRDTAIPRDVKQEAATTGPSCICRDCAMGTRNVRS
jgi:Cysteine-rich CWC